MIFLQTGCYSHALMRRVSFNVLLPEEKKTSDRSGLLRKKFKTLWLLHGRSQNQDSWMRMSSIERYAANYGIAVVMPDAERSWYTDTAYGAKYFTFITKELPEICRSIFPGMSDKREDNMIAGLSMGGYGAVKAALLCPEMYGYCASLSGALDVTRKGISCIIEEWRSIFGFQIESALELEGSEHDLFAIADRNKKEGVPFPKLYTWCGTEDRLILINRDFDKKLNELGVPHLHEESEGDHSWKWWDMHIVSALEYLIGDE